MPSRLIDQQRGDSARRDFGGDFGEMQIHRFDVAAGQNEAGALAFLRTDRAEDVRRGRALILRRRWPRAAFRPSSRDLVFLADARVVGEPDFYRGGIDAFVARDFLQARWETYGMARPSSGVVPFARDPKRGVGHEYRGAWY